MPQRSESPAGQLHDYRKSIDDIDRRLVALLNDRTAIVEKIGQAKKVAGMEIYEPKREEAVYTNIASGNKGPLSNEALQRIFERIIDEMRRVQKERMVQK